MNQLRVRLFGHPVIELDGRAVDPGRRKVTALLSYLAANDSPQPRATVCALLWPEKSSAAARAELRRTVSSLRGSVGAEALTATRSHIALGPQAWVDVREFRALVDSTMHAPSDGTRSAALVEAMESAVALYSDDFLAGFSLADTAAFDDWMIFEAERLRDSLQALLDHLSRPLESAYDAPPRRATPLEYARKWVQLDGSNEAAHRRLMLLYDADGQRGTALKQFEACRRVLAREVGAEPSDETVELKRRIERGLRPRRGAIPPPEGTNIRLPGAAPRRTLILASVLLVTAALSLAGTQAYRKLAHPNVPGIPIAVMPLLDDSGGPHTAWFAGGMTDAIITNLAKVHSLRVTSRASVEVLRTAQPSISRVRSLLGVDYIVEGSVLKVGNRVRITAQLIDAKADRHLWADAYEDDLGDVIALQGRIANDIASHVSARLSVGEKQTLSQGRPVDPHAYEAYLLGAYELGRLPFDLDAGRACRTDLERSIAIDATYAPAHAALANYYWGATQFGLYTSEEGMKRAQAEAARAVRLDPGLSEAHTVLGFVRFLHDYDWTASEREFKRAIELKPSSTEAHRWYGSLLCTTGRFDQAIAEVSTARNLDPLSLINILNVAMRLYYARDYDAAIEQAQVAREMEQGFYMSHLVLGYALAAKGSFGAATDELETAARLAGDGAMEPLAVLSYVYNRAGRAAEARNAEQRFERLEAKGMSLSPLLRAYIPLGRGDYESAMDLIEEAYASRDLNLAWNFQDPFFDPLRALPRFVSLKRTMRL